MKDLIIIGAGTAGLSAALYANLFNLDFTRLRRKPRLLAVDECVKGG